MARYDLGRVSEEAGTVHPGKLWEMVLEAREKADGMVSRFQRQAEQQTIIINSQKDRILSEENKVRNLRAQLRRAGIDPCV